MKGEITGSNIDTANTTCYNNIWNDPMINILIGVHKVGSRRKTSCRPSML